MGAGFDFRFQLFKSSEECVPSSAIAAFTDMGASDVGFNKYLIVPLELMNQSENRTEQSWT